MNTIHFLHIGKGNLGEFPLLFAIYSFFSIADRFLPTRLNFKKYERIPILGDQVDLAQGTSIIPADAPITQPFNLFES